MNIEEGDFLNLSDVSTDMFAKNTYDLDSKWKSLSLHSNAPSVTPMFRPQEKRPFDNDFQSPPHLQRSNVSFKEWAPLDHAAASACYSEQSSSDLIVLKETPYLLMKTHFACVNYSLDSIVDTVEQVLNEALENSYEFLSSECTVSFLFKLSQSHVTHHALIAL